MPIAAIIGAAATLGGAALQSGAASSAAKAQQQASAANLAFQQQVYNTGQNQLTPTINQGTQAGSALGGLLNLPGTNPQASQQAFQNYLGSTNYNFLLNQGLQGVGYLNAPNLYSGATGKSLNNYAQGMAGNALYPYENLLAGQQSLGANSAAALAGVGENIAQQQAQARNLAANAQGVSSMFGGGQYANALGQLFGQSSYGGGGFGNQIANALGGLFQPQQQQPATTANFTGNALGDNPLGIAYNFGA